MTHDARMLLSRDVPARSMRQPIAIGAPLGVELGEDWPAVREYGARVDAYAQSLNHDARAQIVFADPVALEQIAKDYGTGAPAAVAELRARIAARGNAQASKDLAWSARWNPFVVEWTAFRVDLESASPGVPPTIAWGRIQGYEGRLRELAASFGTLGGTTISNPLPPTLETGSGKPDDNTNDTIATVAKAAGVIGVALALGAVAKLVRG